ncbi:hypothetical protein HF259_21060 [Rhizobium leguminosarum]|nr:hypothetical protein [Rhizobium leguminosarum]MBY2942980.1 hypothetical protein [Rhizobium leguminosarum]
MIIEALDQVGNHQCLAFPVKEANFAEPTHARHLDLIDIRRPGSSGCVAKIAVP